MLKKTLIVLLSLFTLACSETNVVSSLKDVNSLPKTNIFNEHFRETFSQDISFWKDIYIKYTWKDIVFYSPETPEIIEVLKIDIENNSDTMNISISAPTIEKIITVSKQSAEDIYFNILNIPEIQLEIDLHYDYLNERYKEKNNTDKDIGMTRGRKELYEERFKNCEEYIAFAEEEFKNNKLPKEISILVLIESGCSPDSKSNKNALGIFQMIPETGRKYGLVVGNNIDERIDAKKETFAAIRYLSELSIEFQDHLWAINAYHSGEGNLRKAKAWAERKYPHLTPSLQFEKIIKEFPEDTEFNNEEIYFYGNNSARYTILFTAMLEAYKEWLSLKEETYTPEWWQEISDRKALEIKYPDEMIKISYTVESGDTLSAIANKYFLTIDLLKLELNKSSDIIHIGDKLIFSHQKFYTLKEYLDKKGKSKILEDKNNFCKKNPSIIDCKNLEELIFPNNSSIYY